MPKWALLLAMVCCAGQYVCFFHEEGFRGMVLRALPVYFFCLASFALAKAYAG